MNELDNLALAKAAVKKLTSEQKLEIITELSQELATSGQVILGGGNFIRAETVFQIQTGQVPLDDVFRAAADKINKDQPFGQT